MSCLLIQLRLQHSAKVAIKNVFFPSRTHSLFVFNGEFIQLFHFLKVHVGKQCLSQSVSCKMLSIFMWPPGWPPQR